MEKVKITQRQANAIEWQKEEARRAHERFKRNHQCDLDEQLYTLLELSTEKYMKALYIGYEVEPEFKVGDWIYGKYTRSVHQVDENNVLDELNKAHDLIRHATPEEIEQEKERKWWKSHGRDVWELKEGDLLKNSFGFIREVQGINESGEYVTLPNFTPFSKKEIRHYFTIACFAEDRLDD